MLFSRGSSLPRDQTVLSLLHWQVGSLPLEPPGNSHTSSYWDEKKETLLSPIALNSWSYLILKNKTCR